MMSRQQNEFGHCGPTVRWKPPNSIWCARMKELEAYIRSAICNLDIVLEEEYEMNRKYLLGKEFVEVSGEEMAIALSLMPTLNKLI